MKKAFFITLNSFIAIIISLSSFAAVAEKSHQQKYNDAQGEQMHVKCYVEYQGGGDDIRFVIGSFKEPNQAMTMLQGRKVGKQNGKTSKTIYKIKQCVEDKERFTSKAARQLDKKLLR